MKLGGVIWRMGVEAVSGALWPRLRLGRVDPRRQGHEFRAGERCRVILDGG